MPQSVQKSKGTYVTMALLPQGVRQKPVDQTLTIKATNATAGISKGATTIPVTAAIAGLIPKGQWLLFRDSDGVERVCQLSADAKPNDETLKVYELPEAIDDGSDAIFPVKLQARTAASVSRTASLKAVITFDSGAERDGTTTSRERNLSASGNYLYYDAGVMTCEYAYQNDQEIWVRRVLPPPSDAYISGKITEGPTAITSIPDEVPADGFITENMEFAFLGFVSETNPKPKP